MAKIKYTVGEIKVSDLPDDLVVYTKRITAFMIKVTKENAIKALKDAGLLTTSIKVTIEDA